MRSKSVDYAKGDASMTDYQFRAYIDLRDKYDALVQDMNQLRQKESSNGEDGMTDYQFRRYEKLRDECEELRREIYLLREENTKLKIQSEMLKALSNDKK